MRPSEFSLPPDDEPDQVREARERLARAVQRAGLPLERLALLMRRLGENEAITRRFLAEQVYGVSDAELDALVRERIRQLDAE